ncbi:MAG: methylmalonyl Co-A mutase-associated GTPase MeaB [Gammaproteobacteria bacterium]|nr:methylmalonyl Co-A mutase-associated GTPase MeaB [Gammaproteobacteria bacterium]
MTRSATPDPAELAALVRAGDRRALARAITLVESSHPADQPHANRLLALLTPHAGRSIRIGVTGVPGVGKSTFIEALGNHAIDQGHRVAVLAVDPSSAISGGSILGDKTRMENLGRRLEAFIRPSPAGRTLGGVTRHTRETLLLAEAAGFDVVLVETVGVGQSETAVADMTDMFLLLLLPGGGDELQGIKRGIMERADLVLVNKCDGDMAPAAARAAADYRNALRFMQRRSARWDVPVETCSARDATGIARVWDVIERFRGTMTESGELAGHRAAQARAWLWSEMAETLIESLQQDPAMQARVTAIESAVAAGTAAPRVAAHELVGIFLGARRNQSPGS